METVKKGGECRGQVMANGVASECSSGDVIISVVVAYVCDGCCSTLATLTMCLFEVTLVAGKEDGFNLGL